MQIKATALADVFICSNQKYGDNRGWFSEVYRTDELSDRTGREIKFVQANESFSTQGTLRGVHFQNPHPQGKLVRVVEGEVFDVAVDLRQSSPTFGGWVGVNLSQSNGLGLWIPEGFGHGFYVISKTAHFVYECTDYYHKECEDCLRYDDPKVGIKWPQVAGVETLLSPKDLQGKKLDELRTFE